MPCRATRSGYPPALPLGLGVHLGENARSKLAPGSGVEKVFVVVRPQDGPTVHAGSIPANSTYSRIHALGDLRPAQEIAG